MDPLSITGTCIALVITISKISIQISGFVREVRDARGDLDAVSRELTSLKSVIEILSEDADNSIHGGFPDTLVRQIYGILANCNDVLGQIEVSLQKYAGGGVTRGVKWSLSGRDDMNKLRSSLEAHKSALDIALDMVAMTVTREIKADTRELRFDTEAIKDDTALMLAEISRYLDDLSSYAESSNFSDEEADSGVDVDTRQVYEPSLSVLLEEEQPELRARDKASSHSPSASERRKTSLETEEDHSENATASTGPQFPLRIPNLVHHVEKPRVSVGSWSQSQDETIRVWDSATGESRGILNSYLDWVRAVAFSPDGKLIASASYDRTVRLWDSATGGSRGILTGHLNWVRAVAFSPDGKLIASASDDKTVRLWDA